MGSYRLLQIGLKLMLLLLLFLLLLPRVLSLMQGAQVSHARSHVKQFCNVIVLLTGFEPRVLGI